MTGTTNAETAQARPGADRRATRPTPRFGGMLWPLSQAVAALGCWTMTSRTLWGAVLVLVGILVIGHEGFGLSAWWSRPTRWAARAAVLAAVGSVVRFAFPAGHGLGFDRGHDVPIFRSAALVWAAGLLALLAIALVKARRFRWRAPLSAPLRLPFESGTWYVVQGGGRSVNHHAASVPQRGAIDIVALGRDGTRTVRRRPLEVTDYVAYGRTVLAPCDGTVVRAVDGLPDQEPGSPTGRPPFGNHVRVDTGHEHVVLAHLRPGSVRVTTGEAVVAGQPIGEVGNSGSTTEPHLHLHAERDGLGLDLSVVGVRGPLCRGRRIKVR